MSWTDDRPPVLRWRDGPLISAAASAAFLVLLLLPAAALAVMMTVQHGHRVGLDVVDAERATVVGLESSGGSRRSCRGVWVEVRWSPSGEGRYRACEDSSLAKVMIGDQVTVRPNPVFGSEVLPEDEPVDWLAPGLVVVVAAISVGSFRNLLE